MSKESAQWLNTMTLIGFTDKRGEAWHYSEALQGSEPNHYTGAIPVEDVERRLFAWEVESTPLYVPDLSGEGYVEVPDRQAMRADGDAPVPGAVFGVFKGGYTGHPYRVWLVDTVAAILDDTLSIGSAGLLRSGAQAWVSVEVPDNVTTPEGVTFRPHLIAATSYDGSLATTYCRACTAVVCDNTLDAGLNEGGERLKLKHTRNSAVRIAEARDALAIVYGIADAFSAEVAKLCATSVDARQFSRVLDIMVPLTDAQGRPVEGAALTLASRKRDEVSRLYRHDDRAAPWSGTAYGVLAAFNTFGQHYGTVRGMSRVQRNRSNAITGQVARSDAAILAAIGAATA